MLTNGTCRGTGPSLMASKSPSDGTISMKMPTISSLQKTVRLASHVRIKERCHTCITGVHMNTGSLRLRLPGGVQEVTSLSPRAEYRI